MTPPDRLRLNTYSDLFQPDRRIHAIDGHRIPIPGGVPIAAIGYAAIFGTAMALLSAAPGLGDLLGLVHPAIRWVVVPLAGAIVLHRQRWSVPEERAPRADENRRPLLSGSQNSDGALYR